MQEVSKLQSSQILAFVELKKSIEEDRELQEIKKIVRDMIDIGLALESAQAGDKIKVIIDPLTLFKEV